MKIGKYSSADEALSKLKKHAMLKSMDDGSIGVINGTAGLKLKSAIDYLNKYTHWNMIIIEDRLLPESSAHPVSFDERHATVEAASKASENLEETKDECRKKF